MIYINKNIGFWEVEIPLTESYKIGTTHGEYLEGAYVVLNESQVAFYNANPGTTPSEVWFMKVDVDDVYIPTDEEILFAAKIAKSQRIEAYDNSDDINSFTFEQTVGWIDVPTRSNYRNSVEAATLLEERDITFELSDKFFTMSVVTANRLLAKVQRYADACAIITRGHLATVESLTKLDEVNNYEYKVGYPDKLVLTTESI